jgi:DNA (cytosine-5)-methyltransferase 1
MSSAIPVIDLFAGPGGLSEGFSRHGEEDWTTVLSRQIGEGTAVSSKTRFAVALSVEMDGFAHATLELRALVRKLRATERGVLFDRFLRGELTREGLFAAAGEAGVHAKAEAWNATLGKEDVSTLDEKVAAGIGGAAKWVLIGGPPCQAYSVAGRSRNRGITGYRAEKDHRHYLYREYLRIVAKHRPPVFVMENVKGLLSSKVGGDSIFEQIREDLCEPAKALSMRSDPLSYELYPVAISPGGTERGAQLKLMDFDATDFVIRMERHGVPQARHRVILLGVRRDLGRAPKLLVERKPVSIRKVLGDLPPLRSGLSRGDDGPREWVRTVVDECSGRWLDQVDPKVRRRIRAVLPRVAAPVSGRGEEIAQYGGQIAYAHSWYRPKGFHFLLNHTSRSHMASDLGRYLFAAAYALVHRGSPTLSEFPPALLPNHENVDDALEKGGNFQDRFRVQLGSKPSTTVTSHIGKDGHYYIHYDPRQCRSLTVREAARLQTFPDDYFFCGPRTEQYHQVGNAVPPLLATQIAGLVADLLA